MLSNRWFRGNGRRRASDRVSDLVAEVKSLQSELKQVTAERNAARRSRDELAETMLQNQVAVISADKARQQALNRVNVANQRVEELYDALDKSRAENKHLDKERRKLAERLSEVNHTTANIKQPLPPRS